MKKIFVIIMTICLVASAFSIGSFAADEKDASIQGKEASETESLVTEIVKVDPPAEGVVLRVSALKRSVSEEYYYPENCNYTDFATGWEAAIDLALDRDELNGKDLACVVVDLYGDWNAKDGEFCNSGDGFEWDAIYFPSGVRVILNMNGYTINRGLEEYQYNGEVICIGSDADVIINNGTIKGGFSCNGAGGIHICGGANVTLNNVNVVGNKVEDDDGAGIAVYGGATLTMIGGSVSDNKLQKYRVNGQFGGGIYVDGSSVYLEGVTIQNNQSNSDVDRGGAIFAKKSDVTLEKCKVIGNDNCVESESSKGTRGVVMAVSGSVLTIIDTEFSGNGHHSYVEIKPALRDNKIPKSLIDVTNSELVMDNCKFLGNESMYLLNINKSIIAITNTDFTDGKSNAFYGAAKSNASNYITNCSFSKGVTTEDFKVTIHFTNVSNIAFTDCSLGNATINNRQFATFMSRSRIAAASMFGGGSLAVIVSFIALVASAASISANMASNKRRGKAQKEGRTE